jgi:F-box-like
MARPGSTAAESLPPLGLRGRHGRRLGADLLETVFSQLSAKELAAVELTCRHWRVSVHSLACAYVKPSSRWWLRDLDTLLQGSRHIMRMRSPWPETQWNLVIFSGTLRTAGSGLSVSGSCGSPISRPPDGTHCSPKRWCVHV